MEIVRQVKEPKVISLVVFEPRFKSLCHMAQYIIVREESVEVIKLGLDKVCRA
jgi:hypothetical protein